MRLELIPFAAQIIVVTQLLGGALQFHSFIHILFEDCGGLT